MSSREKHHFVPRFYLRAFGDSPKTVSLFHLKDKAHRKGVPIKGQCKRNGLYDYAPMAEITLGQIESRVKPLLDRICESRRPIEPFSDHHQLLVFYICLQMSRTSKAAQMVNEFATASYRNMLRSPMMHKNFVTKSGTDISMDEYLAVVDRVQVTYPHPVVEAMDMFLSAHPCFLDLRLAVLANETNTEFITSDSPAVRHNQWRSGTSCGTAVGFTAVGLQLFFPLSPSRCLLLFDESAYSMASSECSSVRIQRNQDVRSINLLQVLHCENALYYRHKAGVEAGIDRLVEWASHYPRERVEVDAFRVGGARPSELLLSRFSTPLPKLGFSFIRVRSGFPSPPRNAVQIIEREWARRILERIQHEKRTNESERRSDQSNQYNSDE